MTTSFRVTKNLYIVEADPTRHSGLHTLTAKHVLARDLAHGDRIVAVLRGQLLLTVADDGSTEATKYGVQYRGTITRDAGRAPLLGEDTLDAAAGGDALAELIPEALSGSRCEWVYAPVSFTTAGDDDRTNIRAWEKINGNWIEEKRK